MSQLDLNKKKSIDISHGTQARMISEGVEPNQLRLKQLDWAPKSIRWKMLKTGSLQKVLTKVPV